MVLLTPFPRNRLLMARDREELIQIIQAVHEDFASYRPEPGNILVTQLFRPNVVGTFPPCPNHEQFLKLYANYERIAIKVNVTEDGPMEPELVHPS
jgi:hypothetical protein